MMSLNVSFIVRQFDPVLRTLRTGQARHDRRQVQLDRVGEHRIRRIVGAEHALRFIVSFDQLDLLFIAAGEAQVVQRFVVDREEAHRCAVFRSHVGNGRTVGQADVAQAGAVELDEFADNAFFAQHLGNGQGQVGGRGAFCQLAGQLEADHFRRNEIQRLAQHAGFRLDAADAPADDAKTVDHRRMGVGSDEGIREDFGFAVDFVCRWPRMPGTPG